MIPFTPAAPTLPPSEPASSEPVVKDSSIKEHIEVLRDFATAHPPSKKILSRSSTENSPIAMTTGGDAHLTLVNSPRLVWLYAV
jgi:hypothetical protein